MYFYHKLVREQLVFIILVLKADTAVRCEKGALDPSPYAIRGTLPYVPFLYPHATPWFTKLKNHSFLAQHPPDIKPAITFLTRFLSLLSSQSSLSAKIFISTLPSQTSFSTPEIHLTTSSTLNFLQLALITVQRAPAVGVSDVQARGMDGGVGKEWEGLVGRYRRVCGGKGSLGNKEVQEVGFLYCSRLLSKTEKIQVERDA